MVEFEVLVASNCTPLRGEEHLLPPGRVMQLLAALPSGWELGTDGDSLLRTYRFENYYQTMAFVNALAYVAHAQDHHPDLGVFYNRVEVRFSTHDVGGLSNNDFICAAKCEALMG